jgi:hypothetical protein
MKTSTKFALLFLAILLSACSITPKYHSLGYHIEWKHNFKQNERSSATKNIIAENTREMYTVDQKAQCLKTQNPEKREIIAPKKLAIVARPATRKQAQQSKYTSYRALTNYAQTSDTPITTKQLRKLAPNPPAVVKINQLLRPIRVAMFALFATYTYSFFLLFETIFYGFVVTYPNLLVLGVTIAPILFLILSRLEIKLFRKRQKIMNELYVKKPEAIRLLKSLDSSIYLVFLIPYIGTPIYHLIWDHIFKKLQLLEPNNPYIELRKRKTRWNMVPGYLSLILTTVPYIVILLL